MAKDTEHANELLCDELLEAEGVDPATCDDPLKVLSDWAEELFNNLYETGEAGSDAPVSVTLIELE